MDENRRAKTTEGRSRARRLAYIVLRGALFTGLTWQLAAQQTLPWMNTALSPEARTELLLDAMTLDQKIQQMQNHPQSERGTGRLRIHAARTPYRRHPRARDSDAARDQRRQRNEGR